MSGLLKRVVISNFRGNKNINISIEDNKIILVGENGSGKTTILRIIFYFLSGDWRNLLQFPFASISALVDNNDITITKDEIRKIHDSSSFFVRKVAFSNHQDLFADLDVEERDWVFDPEISKKHYNNQTRKNIQYENKRKSILSAIDAKIIYLPTYRRIEREISSIFDDDRFKSIKLKNNKPTNSYCVELVEFGMKDVGVSIAKELNVLKDFERESLNSLTIQYLGDVVNKEYENTTLDQTSNIDENKITSVLNRLKDNIFTNTQKEHIFDVINASMPLDQLTEHDKIIYHYFLKLLNLQESLEEKEKKISGFCNLCSSYMTDKEFIYDSTDFSFAIKSKERMNHDIELSDLSSGEKQIVSLFSHLYLSDDCKFFILIDEPELSLSVPWQRRFLCDINKSNFCKGLIAVTHSPFIYENDLMKYAHSLGEFLSNN